ncbi:hypothetical protein [Microbacterium sp.]|uniref:hypothetical protein n=1 Tax=Microbacterium sp. TaxID=51671 RepID=UPI002FE1D88F
METYGNLRDVETSLRALFAEFADDYDLTTLAEDVATYADGIYTIDLDAEQIIEIADAEHRTTADDSDAGEELHQQILDHAARVGSIALTPLVIGDVEVRINGEFQAGGLVRWPTAESFWVSLTTPDGHETVLRNLDGWGDLADSIDTATSQHKRRVEQTTRKDTDDLATAVRHLAEAQAAADAARAARDALIRDAIDRGMTKYRAAQVTGLSQPQIKRIAVAS